MSENLDREPPFRRGVLKSRRSISLAFLLGGYPGIAQESSSRLEEAEDEEGEESVEEEESEETKLEAALGGAPEAPESPNLALYQ
ncbi:hypothetical protein O181_005330 [Austropuccinia psidii MF-1]|uniref:Uncharacterized protein n=1 Tax=Austropuccinia psidii MF-1 TaxID=1389203 RepID=A0A9Q3BIR7_9BASI|nr:hypothetical protein [Austropuccinia psidii MF-1]